MIELTPIGWVLRGRYADGKPCLIVCKSRDEAERVKREWDIT